MGGTGFDPISYHSAVVSLNASGSTFRTSSKAAATGDYKDTIAKHLNPRKLKKGIREACFAAGFKDAMAIVVGVDATGSMRDVPYHIQQNLYKLISLLVEEGISDHPNVLFMCHDDETVVHAACFQMSQFETSDKELLDALNELIIPGMGGGNRGESYHLSVYAGANHTRTDEYDKNGKKGFFFIIGDEEPCLDAEDPAIAGTSPEIAKELFGDVLQGTVPMLDSMKKLVERYHVFVIRPGQTSNASRKEISKMWRDLLSTAGENPQNVLDIPETEAIIPTMALSIGRISGVEVEELADVLKTQGSEGVETALAAVSAVPKPKKHKAKAKASSPIETK